MTIMKQTLLILGVDTKTDVLRARQRTRQIAGLLGYAPEQQATLAATVFYLAHQLLVEGGVATLEFAVNDAVFLVQPTCSAGRHPELLTLRPPASTLKLQQPLPPRNDALPAVDLAWLARELNQRTPLELFAEIQRQNQELLAAHLELQACRKELARFQKVSSSEPAA
jgi:hypothetical protein